MSIYFRLRAVPPPALRNSAAWLQRLFEDEWDAVRDRVSRHREEVLDGGYLDHELLYAGGPPHDVARGPHAQVVLGGRPVWHPDPLQPPFLLLSPVCTARVATHLTTADFDALWERARAPLTLGAERTEPETRAKLAETHRSLTAFYTTAARHGDAVVKWLVPERSARHGAARTPERDERSGVVGTIE
ncbi:hypothetical protein BN159_7538 [Streptomyces davaonensis JCM 4913]|uniref:DUF1877 domain-containing protein n=1 Tax=Streptomyces davaonensis (strain DSM 101723 / JCM 4913 / KCC S-0913 / 768) TaxID=1214101 RepID=K4RED5_STRDJ|nr:DUF1877 family protein [Streptomyces davaonensis]CCK31917.1 hypothetical protein BN159_7538 [Streptomyces davaonensis JCM 4913]